MALCDFAEVEAAIQIREHLEIELFFVDLLFF